MSYTKPKLLVHTNRQPSRYKDDQQRLTAWPKILKDCQILGQYLGDELRVFPENITAPDMEFINLSVEEEQRRSHWYSREQHRAIVKESRYALGWTIAHNTIYYDPDSKFRVIDSEVAIRARDFTEDRFAITSRDGLVRLTSPRVAMGTEYPFGEPHDGLLRVPVPNIRPGHVDDDEKKIGLYLYNNEESFSDDFWSMGQVYKKSLVFMWENRLANADIANADLVLAGLRGLYKDVK